MSLNKIAFDMGSSVAAGLFEKCLCNNLIISETQLKVVTIFELFIYFVQFYKMHTVFLQSSQWA